MRPRLRLQALTLEDVTQYLDRQLGSVVSGHSLAPVTPADERQSAVPADGDSDHLVRKGLIRESGDGWRVEAPLDALEAAVPASLVGTVVRELDELAPDERQAIDAAAVVGVEFSLWLAARAADVDELALEPVLEVLARRRTFIVREGVVEMANGLFSPLYRFAHGLYQEIVLEQMATRPRADAHARAGLAMERVFSGREHEAAADSRVSLSRRR